MGLVLLPFSHRPVARGNIPEIHLSSGDLLTSDWNGKDQGIGEGRTIRIGRGRMQPKRVLMMELIANTDWDAVYLEPNQGD